VATETIPTERPRVDDVLERRTIPALWRRATAKPRSFPAYLVEGDGSWDEVSGREAAERVDLIANGLLALGIRKGDAFAIIGTTRLEWVLVDFALALVGATIVPIYPNSSSAETAYILADSGAVGVFVESEKQRNKIDANREQTPGLRHLLGFDGLDSLAESGEQWAAEHPGRLEQATAAIDEDDLFTLQYTSGTTGPPKGCMMRHRNYFEMADCITRVPGFVVERDVMLLYLPLAHNFGRLMHLLGAHIGFTLALLPNALRVAEVLPEVKPTVFPSVPRVYEKVYTAIKGQFESATGAKAKLIQWALHVGYRASPYKQQGRRLPPALAAQHRIADRLVYAKVKERLGGRLRFGVAGGAPLAQEIAEFFHALDILILEGYGLSECTTACSVNLMESIRFGTVGLPLPGFELKTAEDGEILIRSETIFAGYLGDEEATRAVLTGDGWLRSGDIGEIDHDGFVRITDRKKDLIVTAGGKNVAPQNIENALKSSRLVSQALVVGDRRKYIAALITLDPDEAAKWAVEQGLPPDPARLADEGRLRAEVKRLVGDMNSGLSRHEQVKRFAVLPRDFTLEEDELTPTLKLKRRVCERHFAEEIEALYR